jgi:hypothetical protein
MSQFFLRHPLSMSQFTDSLPQGGSDGSLCGSGRAFRHDVIQPDVQSICVPKRSNLIAIWLRTLYPIYCGDKSARLLRLVCLSSAS